MNKKGFTLIELLAVIVILAVLMVIAVPKILDVIENSRKSAAKSSAEFYIDAIEKNNAIASIGNSSKIDDGTYDVTTLDVNIKGDKPTSGEVVVEKSKVTSAKICIMDYVVRFENRTAIVGKKCSEEELTYKAYSIGDDVTLKDDTTWIVVKDSLESDGEIKIMSSLNINKNLESETTLIGKDMFVSDESSGNYKLAYDTTESNNWDSSTLKSYLENVVKERLQQSLKTEIIEISILGAEELVSLGCELTGSEEDGYKAVSCDTTTEWYEKVFNSTGFWTKLRYENTKSAWYINKKTIYYYRVKETTIFGARPVITVSKSAIK